MEKNPKAEKTTSKPHQILVHMFGATQSTIIWSIQILWRRVSEPKKNGEKSPTSQNHALNEFLCANNAKLVSYRVSIDWKSRYHDFIKSEKVDISMHDFAEIFTF